MEAASSSADTPTFDVAKEKLEKAYQDMNKAAKATQKLLDEATMIEGKSARMQSCIEELCVLAENLESSIGDLGFFLKFKKTKAGQPLNNESAKAFLVMAAKMLNDIIDVTKLTRSLLPKKIKDA